MNILYLHGFGSEYNSASPKTKMLEKFGSVSGVNIDYTRGFTYVYELVSGICLREDIDLLVGTSMGGYTASHVGARLGIPFVALNPAVTPNVALHKYTGTDITDYTGRKYTLTSNVVDAYPEINTDGCGCVIVELGDEIIPALQTQWRLDSVYEVHVLPGGSHRFTDLKTASKIIGEFSVNSMASYGAVLE